MVAPGSRAAAIQMVLAPWQVPVSMMVVGLVLRTMAWMRRPVSGETEPGQA